MTTSINERESFLVFFSTGPVFSLSTKSLIPPGFISYNPSGWTALYDAIGEVIKDLEGRVGKDEKVVIAILTDGKENSSTEYSKEVIFEKISHWEKWHPWTFIYLGANQDAFEEGGSMGITTSINVNLTTATDVSDTFILTTDAVDSAIQDADSGIGTDIPWVEDASIDLSRDWRNKWQKD